MADEWQSAWVEVLPDFSDFKNRANPQITTILSGAGTAGGIAASSSMGAVFAGSFFGTVLANLGTRIVSSITQSIQEGVQAGLTYAFDAVGLASELEQSIGSVTAVFKEQAGVIREFADAAVESVGLTRAEYQNFATVVGAQLTNLGLPFDEVSGKTTDLIQLGADLAATYGGPTSQAVAALSSLLRGERDPIERYGVGLKQVDINAQLAANGMTGLTGEALKQATIVATLELLWKQTQAAQGRFAAEESTFAGQQQRFNAALTETQTVLGEMLLPAATEFLGVLRQDFLPILQETIAEVGPILAEALRESVPAFKDLLIAIAPLLPDLVKLGVELLPPLIALIVAASPALIELAESMASGAENLNALLAVFDGSGTIDEFFASVASTEGALVEFQAGVVTTINGVSKGIQDFLGDVSRGIQQAVGFFQSIPQALSGAGNWLVNSGRALIQGFINGINQMTRPVRDAVNGVMSVVSGFFPRSPAQYGPFAGAGWEAVKHSGRALFDQFDSGFDGQLGGSLGMPGVSIPRGVTPASVGGGAGFGFMDPEERRLLRDLANKAVEISVDSQTVARATISGSARLSAQGAF